MQQFEREFLTPLQDTSPVAAKVLRAVGWGLVEAGLMSPGGLEEEGPVGRESLIYHHSLFKFNPVQRYLEISGEKKTLTPKQSDLLLFLAKNAQSVVSFDEIMLRVWGIGPDLYDKSLLRTHVYNLRKIFTDKNGNRLEIIRTISHRGYMLLGQIGTSSYPPVHSE